MSSKLAAQLDEYLCWAYAGTSTESYCKELRQLHQYVPQSEADSLLVGVREICLVHNILRSVSNRPSEQLEDKIKEIVERMGNDAESSISDNL